MKTNKPKVRYHLAPFTATDKTCAGCVCQWEGDTSMSRFYDADGWDRGKRYCGRFRVDIVRQRTSRQKFGPVMRCRQCIVAEKAAAKVKR